MAANTDINTRRPTAKKNARLPLRINLDPLSLARARVLPSAISVSDRQPPPASPMTERRRENVAKGRRLSADESRRRRDAAG